MVEDVATASDIPTLPIAGYESVRPEANSLQFNLGITWDMDIHRMIKERAARIAAQPAIDTYYK